MPVGPIVGPRLDEAQYREVAVWATRRAAIKWARDHNRPMRDVFKILAGSRNMTFTQWIIRDAAGMAVTEKETL